MPAEDPQIASLYHELVEAWNARNAGAFAGAFADDGVTYGFDGSELRGRAAIADELGRIFADHDTGRYVAIVRSVRPLGVDVALLQAVVGMVPPGRDDVEPELNAAQTLLAELRELAGPLMKSGYGEYLVRLLDTGRYGGAR